MSQGGRGSETPGEDPLRIQGYVKRLLTGLEGTDGGYFNASGSGFKKMIATCKHFAGYDWKTGMVSDMPKVLLLRCYTSAAELCQWQDRSSGDTASS